MLELVDLVFSRHGRRLLDGVSLSLAAGECVALLGGNGAGKSTLLRIAAGLLGAASGEVRVGGEAIAALAPAERARRIGYLPQFHEENFAFTVRDIVLAGRAGQAGASPAPRDLEVAAAAMARLSLTELADRHCDRLSGGERQRAMLARVVAQAPRVLLLDEPLSHLDLAHQMQLIAVLRELAAEGTGVLAVLHDPNHAALLGARTLVLEGGRIVPLPDEAAARAALLARIYGVPLASVALDAHTWLLPRFVPESRQDDDHA